MNQESPVRRLSDDECWEFLRSQEFGRLAFHLAGEVHIAPVNYVVDGSTLLFRSAEGDKLLGIVMNADVAFEIDSFDDTNARSVILRGTARKLEEDEEHRVDALPLRPWVNQLRYNVVEITPTEISGRAFDLERS